MHYVFQGLLVATQLLTAKFHSLYVKETESGVGVGVGNFGKVAHSTSSSAILARAENQKVLPWAPMFVRERPKKFITLRQGGSNALKTCTLLCLKALFDAQSHTTLCTVFSNAFCFPYNHRNPLHSEDNCTQHQESSTPYYSITRLDKKYLKASPQTDIGRLHHKCNRLRLLATCSITNKQNHNVIDYDYDPSRGLMREKRRAQLPGRRIIARGAEKSQQCHKYFFQYMASS